MKITSMLLTVTLLTAMGAMAQKYITKNGSIRFFSDAPLEKIEAINHQVQAALDTQTGEIVFHVLMKSFVFEKALMQEHFNENYVESDKFPNAIFSGKIANLEEINFHKGGTYETLVEGKLTLHGVTKTIREKGNLKISDGRITATSVFPLLLSDYDVRIPRTVAGNISTTVEITVEAGMDILNL